MTKELDPNTVAGLLTADEAVEAKEAVKLLRDRDRTRLDAARDAFERPGPNG